MARESMARNPAQSKAKRESGAMPPGMGRSRHEHQVRPGIDATMFRPMRGKRLPRSHTAAAFASAPEIQHFGSQSAPSVDRTLVFVKVLLEEQSYGFGEVLVRRQIVGGDVFGYRGDSVRHVAAAQCVDNRLVTGCMLFPFE